MDKNLEFNQKQIDRIDDVYNAVYDCILTIVGKSSEEYPKDIGVIGPITEDIINSLLDMNAANKIYFPSRIQEPTGDAFIEDYYINGV